MGGLDSSDLIAIIAVIMSAGALALEVRRWYESGPKMHLSVMPDAVTYPHDDGKSKILLTVTNRGEVPTTITHMLVFTYKSRFHRKPDMTGIVGNPVLGQLPHEVGPNKSWMGIVNPDEKLMEARRQGLLYVGISASHSDKEHLVKVPPRKKELPKQTIGDKKANPAKS